MTFTTLITIHELLTEELKRQDNALNLTRQKRNKDEDTYDDMIAHEENYTEEQIAEAKKQMEFSKELYEKVWKEYDKVKEALDDFNNHEWR